jgi:light-regulated signal transduction histidine kinase (bacteriophytochrome)
MYNTFHDNKDAHGIGLFLAKNQVESMGGTIGVRSKLGEGTTFMRCFQSINYYNNSFFSMQEFIEALRRK